MEFKRSIDDLSLDGSTRILANHAHVLVMTNVILSLTKRTTGELGLRA